MTEQQPEVPAVCEHFYASHCYRGISIRLCMTCHEPDWDDLAEQLGDAARGPVVPAAGIPGQDAARALSAAPECSRECAGASLAGCPTPCDDDCELNADGCHESHQPAWKRWHAPGWSCGEVQRAIAEAVSAERERAEYWHRRWMAALERADEDGAQAISQHMRIQELTARAGAAEAKLAEVRGVLLEGGQDAETVRRRLLAIIGTEEESRG